MDGWIYIVPLISYIVYGKELAVHHQSITQSIVRCVWVRSCKRVKAHERRSSRQAEGALRRGLHPHKARRWQEEIMNGVELGCCRSPRSVPLPVCSLHKHHVAMTLIYKQNSVTWSHMVTGHVNIAVFNWALMRLCRRFLMNLVSLATAAVTTLFCIYSVVFQSRSAHPYHLFIHKESWLVNIRTAAENTIRSKWSRWMSDISEMRCVVQRLSI